MQLVRIADCISDIVDGQRSQFQQLRGFGHAVAEQELLRGLSDGILEDPAKIGPVQSAEGGDALDGYVILKILFYIIQCFFYIKIAHPPVCGYFHGCCRPCQKVKEQIEMTGQVE